MVQTISRQQIQQALQAGEALVLVEALPLKHFQQAHLPSAVQINHDEVDSKAEDLLPDKQARIVVYCSNLACANSTKAAVRLAQLGYSNVFKYAEGKQDWMEAGLAVEQA